MKKIVFSIVALLALAFSASAQDTVDFRDGHHIENYFYGTLYDSAVNLFSNIGLISGFGDGINAQMAKRIECDGNLVVYGIAVGIRDLKKVYDLATYMREVYDTSTALAYDYLRIYPAGTDTLQCLAQVKLHMRVNPVAYHAIFLNQATTDPTAVVDMYERYFNTPVTVTDSFYIGMTNSHNIPYVDSASSTRWEFASTPPLMNALNTHSWNIIEKYFYFDHFFKWKRYDSHGLYLVIFPILTPAPADYQWDTIPMAGGDTIIGSSDTILAGDTIIIRDTAIVSDTIVVGYDTIVVYDTIILGDTILGIDDHGMLGRLTGVMPNPAAETAKVVSSFGLSRVEAYNLAGEKVDDLRLPSPSLSATLDLRRWPVGAYILRIHTPMGVATKKLTVAR